MVVSILNIPRIKECTFMKAKTKKQSKKSVCPHCGKAFHSRGLPGHIRYNHPGNPSVLTALPKDEAEEPKVKRQSVKLVAPATAVNTSVYQSLQTAIEVLKKRDREIQEELFRLADLQAEKEAIGRELEAVETAIKVFRR
jgi:hypothetical protein